MAFRQHLRADEHVDITGIERQQRLRHLPPPCHRVAIDPRDPNVLFASSWERVRGPYFLQSGGPGSALWKSTDGGETWSEVSGGGFPVTTKGRIGLAIAAHAGENPAEVALLGEAGCGGDALNRRERAGQITRLVVGPREVVVDAHELVLDVERDRRRGGCAA